MVVVRRWRMASSSEKFLSVVFAAGVVVALCVYLGLRWFNGYDAREEWIQKTEAHIRSDPDFLELPISIQDACRSNDLGFARQMVQRLTGWNNFVIGVHTNHDGTNITLWIMETVHPVRSICIFEGSKPQPDMKGYKEYIRSNFFIYHQ